MLTALDLLNRFLNYFNISDKPKGKAFTVVAFIANFYLLYVAINNLRFPHYRVAGALFMLAFLVLEYFIVLNYFYYFTDKQVKFDISPKVEKALGGNQAQAKAAEESLTHKTSSGPSAGLFADDKILPTVVSISPKQQENLNELVDQMVAQGALATDYQGLDDHAIQRVAQKTKKPVLAIGGPVELPFFSMQEQDGDFIILGGLNALAIKPLATVQRIGLMPVAQAKKDYQLAPAHVYLTGGQAKKLGRHDLMTQESPYALTVQLAYTPKDEVKQQATGAQSSAPHAATRQSKATQLPPRRRVHRDE